MIRSLATTATSSRGGSKNGNRIGVRWKCGSQKLDVAPSRLATSSSPDQRDNGGGENSRSIPTRLAPAIDAPASTRSQPRPPRGYGPPPRPPNVEEPFIGLSRA